MLFLYPKAQEKDIRSITKTGTYHIIRDVLKNVSGSETPKKEEATIYGWPPPARIYYLFLCLRSITHIESLITLTLLEEPLLPAEPGKTDQTGAQKKHGSRFRYNFTYNRIIAR